VIQHISCEPPGLFEDVLRDRGATIHRVEIDEGEPLPDWRGFEAIIAMGGPMSVNDDADLPWLTAEKRLIGEAVRAGVPYWGACLGSQLLAAALGAPVYAGTAPEVGVMAVQRVPSARYDPLFAGLPDEFLTLQWHGDTFDLPEGAELLASSPAYPHQAFRWGRHAYGVQFHLEVSPAMAREWAGVPAYAVALERMQGPGAVERLVEDLERHGGAIQAAGRAVFERWLNLAAEGMAPQTATA
jgi:GMP synthase-like glutamine amidotransferase